MINYVVRPVKLSDIDQLYRLTENMHVGLTSLSKNRQTLQKKIEDSVDKFHNFSDSKKSGNYLFVAENQPTGKIAGISSLYNWRADSHELYFFLIETLEIPKSDLAKKRELKVLHTIAYNERATEFRGLFVSPLHQKEGLGHLLSKSRCLFLAVHPHLFESTVFAQMQGVSDDKMISPFWNAIGRHFLDLDYTEVMRQLQLSRTFIIDILPKYPIYASLLPKDAQEVIGKTHKFSSRALSMLAQEGFQLTKEVDLFDAGPKIEAFAQDLLTVKKSRLATVSSISSDNGKKIRVMICNNRLDFRCCYTHVMINDNGDIALDRETVQVLDIDAGDLVRYVL